VESMLFDAMTKPPEIFGVDAEYFLMMSLVGMLVFGVSDNLFYALIVLPLYLIGYLESKKDKYFFKVILKRFECGFSQNQSLWRCQVYEPY